ncbi:DNA-binding SARP family transcriptional activator/tetratricopeptide (TPR) repeat protein [Nonomuraea thailandensis]|uniref:DNA-binding SARP family transcriptional activator/tetratricopeptide (TPR) repeat protein n=1 Tax=Nonomuraea thailandensis TaxID=1188745 RepID=A0A9X2JZI2_9ACTN|nr:BTAD domain-containing putative transcriptional regulator [Nonomuraea thailandensis]MCP2353785.1 DNA-binding SARP family transcriptional activator/tetratricopeptide (TPR) repeat protein [Nonomuraea thailandensis]
MRDGVPVTVSALKQRIALATLLLQANQHVSLDQLAERMWDGKETPDDARGAVQTHIARLRRILRDRGDDGQLIHTREEGYVLQLAEKDLDVAVFLDLVGRAKRAGQAGDEAGEADLLQRSLALWRGPALVDVPSESLYRDHVLVLNEQRVQVMERWFELGLRSGGHDELVVELKAATAAHPLRERLWAQLMLALYRSGHQAEALQVYNVVGDILRQELGIHPGDELRKLHHDILTGDHGLLVPSAPASTAPVSGQPDGVPAPPPRTAEPGPVPSAVLPRQLPADITHFTGRLAELATLEKLVSGGQAPRPIVVDGPAGVGKTALAIRWAYLVQDRFPDGQLYLDLRGFGPDAPVEPAAAVEMLLRALGVAAEQLPAELDARSALLRTLTAGRRALILLDNARDEAQVRPLLPGAQSQVLITSRSQLRGLGAREGAFRVTLDVFSPDEAHALLAVLLAEERLRAAPQAETELGELCSRLPLALSIAAANLDANPHLSLTDYVGELRDNRLAALEAGSDQAAAVRATLDVSYTALPEPQRRVFRLLGLVPGADFTAEVTAALAGCSIAEARRNLDALASFHLIRMHGPGRYTFHDLLRLYAADHARSDDTPGALLEAERRLYNWHLHSVLAAAEILHPHWVRLPPPPLMDTVSPVTFDGQERAVAWLEAEHANLVAMIHDAPRHGQSEMVWLLTDALRGHFWLSRRLEDWLSCARSALTAAVAVDDRAAQAVIQLSLANAQTFQDRPERSMGPYARALSLAEEVAWLDCQAFALAGLANAHLRLGYPQEAVEHLNQALTRRADDTRGQDSFLNNLAVAYAQLGQLELALDHLDQAMNLAMDKHAVYICNLGEVNHSLGRLDEAVRLLSEGISLCRQSGDRGVELECMVLLAAVHRDLGRHAEAIELADQALTMCQDLGDRILQAGALNVLGAVHHDLGRYREAFDRYQEALDASKQGNHRHPEVASLIGLANAAAKLGHLPEAVAHAERAHTIARHRSFRVLEGLALTALAEIGIERGAWPHAVIRAKQAVALHRATGHRLGEARALRVIGDALHKKGGALAAEGFWREAHDLFSAVGTPEAATVGALIEGPAGD